VSAVALPRTVIAAERATAVERVELHSAGIQLSAFAMTLLRGAGGFLTFLIAFWLRDQGAATAFFGVVLSASAIGTLIGNVSGPQVRVRLREELMLLAALIITAVAGVVTALLLGKATAAIAAGLVGFGAAIARLAFDATLQREAPDANQGRAFAQFETRFQLAWVLGAFVPVAIPIPGALGFLVVGLVALGGAAWYVVGMRTWRTRGSLPTPMGRRLGRFLHDRRVARDARRHTGEA
jgi:cyanate permease